MAEFFASGRVVDLVLAVLALELIALLWWKRKAGRAQAALNALGALLPGACLLMALRASLTDAPWMWVAFWLALSFPIHLFDLWRRG
jgi:hypothetical protein